MTESTPTPMSVALVASAEGATIASGGERVRYRWRVRADDAPLGVGTVNDRASSGDLRLERTARFEGERFHDHLHAVNGGPGRRSLSIDLEVDADAVRVSAHALAFDVAGDALLIDLDPLAAAHPNGGEWELSLAPGERVTIGATLAFAPLTPPDRAG